VGIDIRFANKTAPVWPMQSIILEATGTILDNGTNSDGLVIGGTWQVSYKGLMSPEVLSASASAKEVYLALSQINNTELRHINVNRYTLDTNTYDYDTFKVSPSTEFTSGYEWRVTFFDNQYRWAQSFQILFELIMAKKTRYTNRSSPFPCQYIFSYYYYYYYYLLLLMLLFIAVYHSSASKMTSSKEWYSIRLHCIACPMVQVQ
jgi:hypothetical protein